MIRYEFKQKPFANRDLSAYDSDLPIELFRSMLRIRRIEEEIENRYHEDEMKTPIHLVIGQEATSVGVCKALKTTDRIYATHRTHGNYLAKGGDLKKMMSELYCRADGCAGSRGGSMHLIDHAVGMAGSSAIVGGSMPIATGSAFAAKYFKTDVVTGVFFGDAACEEGVVWESLNFAALKKLPILYVCENNFYSVCSPLDSRQPVGTSLTEKAAAFGIQAECIEANDVLTVYEAAEKAVAKIRAGEGPVFLECIAYRRRGHGGAGDDSHAGYRDPEEVKLWEQVCPVDSFREALAANGLLDDVALANMEAELREEILEAFDHAINSPNPVEEDLYTFAYAD
jgi:TPP-dependent pyruvate/acetoin dehydrogenase alpha subunit